MKFCKKYKLLHVLPKPGKRIIWTWQGRNGTVFQVAENDSRNDCLVELINISVPAIVIIVATLAILKYKCSKGRKFTEDSLLPFHTARSLFCTLVLLTLFLELFESLLTTVSLSSILTILSTFTLWALHRETEIRDGFATAISAGGFSIIGLSRAWKLLYLYRYDLSIQHVRFATTIVIAASFGILAFLDLYTFHRVTKRRKKFVVRQLDKVTTSYKHSTASFLSKITFHWITDLLVRGYNASLELRDLGELPEEESARCQFEKFRKICQNEKSEKGELSLWRCFWKQIWLPFAFGGLLKLLGDALTLVGPMAISKIIDYVTVSQNGTLNDRMFGSALKFSEILENGYFLGLLVFFAGLIQSTLSQTSSHILCVEGIRLRTALQTLLYDKALRLGSWNITDEEKLPVDKEKDHRRQQISDIGTLTNLISEDAYNIMSFFWIGHYTWAIPLKIVAIVFLLYNKLGISAIIGVLCCILIVTPMQLVLGKRMSKNCKSIAERSDERLRLVNEILQGMKLVKLRAWEDIFENRIKQKRNEELKLLDKDSIYWTLINFLTHASSIFTTLFTFGIYFWLEEQHLEVGSVFASLALFSQLMVPLLIFPVMIPIIINAKISTRRIEEFLQLPEILNILPAPMNQILENRESNQSNSNSIDESVVEGLKLHGSLGFFDDIEEDEEEQPHCSKEENVTIDSTADTIFKQKEEVSVLKIKSCSFSWGLDENQLHVKDLTFPRGQLTVVVGNIGSGKSSLLLAMLGEIQRTSGSIEWTKGLKIAYVAQKPWLLNATLKDNILFGSAYKPRRYRNVLRACALQPDIEILPDHDLTRIGEKGINLSGGQKQRVTIARAIYSEADVILMDDPLSALDQEVGQEIFDQGIQKCLLKSGRTVIMVTHKLELLSTAHQIVVMEDCKVRAFGTKSSIEDSDPELAAEWKKAATREVEKCNVQKTVKDRWSLIRLVSRIGINLKRKNTTDGSWIIDQDAHVTPPTFVPLRMRRTTLSGSRYLAHDLTDLPVPMEDCRVTKKSLKRHFNARSLSLPLGKGPRIFRWNSIPTVLENRYVPLRKRDHNVENEQSSSFIRRIFCSRTSHPVDTVSNVERNDRRRMAPCNSRRRKLHENQKHKSFVKRSLNPKIQGANISIDIKKQSGNCLQHQESICETKNGMVTKMICTDYLRTGGWISGLTYIGAAIVCQILRTCTDFWLSRWTNHDSDEFLHQSQDIVFYFNIYMLLSVSSILLSFIYNAAGQWAGGKARRKFHEEAVQKLLRVPISFFETNSVGKILNRFSADMGVIDKKISTSIQRLTSFALLCCSAMIVNIIISPWFLIAMIPTCGAYYVIQRFYRRSASDLQRLDGSTRGPIAAHFSETLCGLPTLRASREEKRFMKEAMRCLNSNTNAFLILNTSSRWLGIALDYLGAVILVTAIFTAIISAEMYPDHVTPSMVGLAINYTLLVPIYLNWVVKIIAEIEMYMGSIARISAYRNTSTEDYREDGLKMSEDWPSIGEIIFEDVSLRYDSQSDPVISNLSLRIPPGQKLGICGRTGSGKSSTVMALFQLIDINQGRILIDGMDIRRIPLKILRSRLSTIPQDVIMFSGTIRENLDPLSEYGDEELWKALELAQIKNIVSSHPEGLNFEVREGGENFSSGQLQLLCMARAILRKSSIVILDEATSALDATTEKCLLKAISIAFKNKTVITIAHRPAALSHCDRIIVFDEGKIVEDNATTNLTQCSESKQNSN